tara:strand:+ start:51 stop:410 length:360 start_codon:yes stop_codon:yes gene_type:complete
MKNSGKYKIFFILLSLLLIIEFLFIDYFFNISGVGGVYFEEIVPHVDRYVFGKGQLVHFAAVIFLGPMVIFGAYFYSNSTLQKYISFIIIFTQVVFVFLFYSFFFFNCTLLKSAGHSCW